MKTIMGYKRANGKHGIRNNVLVISLIQCANSTANFIARSCHVPCITIDTGCGEFADQKTHESRFNTRGQHPNTYGVLLVSLGCQWTDPKYIGSKSAGTRFTTFAYRTKVAFRRPLIRE